MADNVSLPASGVAAASDEVTHSGDTVQVQIIQLAFVTGSEGSKTLAKVPGNETDGLLVNLGSNNDVTIPSAGVASGLVSVTRPSNTTTYTAGDVVGATAAAITFPGFVAGEILLTSATLQIEASALIGSEGAYSLHLYNVTPPSALADNAAWDLPSGDRASYLGKIDLGTPVDLGSTLRCDADQINKQITSLGTNLFGYLVTTIGYQPTSARVYSVALHGMRV